MTDLPDAKAAITAKWGRPGAVRNRRGEWVPAIPLPFFGLRKECQCGKQFWTADGYRGHYAYAHILGMESDGAPVAAASIPTPIPDGEE